jgi:LytS/YehU family sensor histidine kinase
MVTFLGLAMVGSLLLPGEGETAFEAARDLAAMAALVVLQVLVARWRFRALRRKGVALTPEREAVTAIAVMVVPALLTLIAAAAPDVIADPVVGCQIVMAAMIETVVVAGLWLLATRYPAQIASAREAEELRGLAEAEALRARLDPHFVLNTLNAIAGLVDTEPDRARVLIADLGELLRDAVTATLPARALRDEVDWLRRYGELLAARYEGDVEVTCDIDDDVADELLPPLTIQPLVENAVLHSAAIDGRRQVRVTANRRAGALLVTVASGPAARRRREGTGSGLELVRRRLALWCPGASLALELEPDATRAVVRVPRADVASHAGPTSAPSSTTPDVIRPSSETSRESPGR